MTKNLITIKQKNNHTQRASEHYVSVTAAFNVKEEMNKNDISYLENDLFCIIFFWLEIKFVIQLRQTCIMWVCVCVRGILFVLFLIGSDDSDSFCL